MFTSKAQFIEATEVAYKLDSSLKESGLSLNQYRDKFLKQIFGDRVDSNNAASLFDSSNPDITSFVKFIPNNGTKEVSCVINTRGKEKVIVVGSKNSNTIIPAELKKLCKKSPSNVSKVFSDRLFDYVHDTVLSEKMKQAIEEHKKEIESEELDFFGHIDSDLFSDIFDKYFLEDLFSENGLKVDDLGLDVSAIIANDPNMKLEAEYSFDEIRIKDLCGKGYVDENMKIEVDFLIKQSIKQVVYDTIGIHLRNFYLNIETLDKDNDEQKMTFFISEFLKYPYLSWQYRVNR